MSSDPSSELSVWQSRVYRRTLLIVGASMVLLVLLGLGVGMAIIKLSADTELGLEKVWSEAKIGWIFLATVCVLLGTASHGPRMRPLLPDTEGNRRRRYQQTHTRKSQRRVSELRPPKS